MAENSILDELAAAVVEHGAVLDEIHAILTRLSQTAAANNYAILAVLLLLIRRRVLKKEDVVTYLRSAADGATPETGAEILENLAATIEGSGARSGGGD